jgi:GR25 family glycosyltransferase involved in LPS biosynthesis
MELYTHIFVINLDHRTDRLESITKELQDFKWERFSAIRPDVVPNWFLPNNIYSYRLGSYGCLQSHYNIVKIAKERNYNRILIFEDDTGFKNSIDILYKAYEQLNSKNLKWGLLYLAGNHREKCIRIDENVVQVVKSYAANSYIIDSSVYDMILQEVPTWNREIDVYYSDVVQKRVNCYCTSPHITYQKPNRSDILNRDVSYEGVDMIDPV